MIFCTIGTANVILGHVTEDSINQCITAKDANQFIDIIHLRYLSSDTFQLLVEAFNYYT